MFSFICQLLNQWQDDFFKHLFVEPVLSVEADGVGIVLVEKVVGVDLLVLDAEESIAVLAVPVADILELLALHLVVVQDDVTGDAEGLLVVFATVEELVLPRLEDAAHCGHVECGVDTDTHKSTHLLGIHTAH